MTKRIRNILILVFGLPMIGIGIFATMVILNVYNRIELDRTVATQKSIEEIQKAVEIYKLMHNGRGPDSIEVLAKEGSDERPPLLRSGALVDSWRTPYRFEKNGKAWTITSAGPDRKFGTKDDVTNMREP